MLTDQVPVSCQSAPLLPFCPSFRILPFDPPRLTRNRRKHCANALLCGAGLCGDPSAGLPVEGFLAFTHTPIWPKAMKMEIVIAIATAIMAFLGAMIGYWISARSSRKDRKHQLAMAALEKRLEVHQEAITIWFSIRNNIFNNQELNNIVIHAQEWYRQNCLYLDDASREDFWNCSIQAPHYAGLVQSFQEMTRQRGGTPDEKTYEMVNESWDIIHKPAYSIPAGVKLPSFGSSDPPLKENS